MRRKMMHGNQLLATTLTGGGHNYVNDVQHESMYKTARHVRTRKNDGHRDGDGDHRRSGLLASGVSTQPIVYRSNELRYGVPHLPDLDRAAAIRLVRRHAVSKLRQRLEFRQLTVSCLISG